MKTAAEWKKEVEETQEQIRKWRDKLDEAHTQYALWIQANQNAQTQMYFAECDEKKQAA